MTQELKNCPFCNGKAEIIPYKAMGYTIRCRNCSIKRSQIVKNLSKEWLRDKMIKTWNTRAEPETVQTIYEWCVGNIESKGCLEITSLCVQIRDLIDRSRGFSNEPEQLTGKDLK